jgi:hypothetical protein
MNRLFQLCKVFVDYFQVPTLVEKMISGSSSKYPSLSGESLGAILKQPWDPVGNAIFQLKPVRLPTVVHTSIVVVIYQ